MESEAVRMQLNQAQVFDEKKGFVKRDICILGERIVAHSQGEAISLEGCYIIPTLSDLHVHGCVGADVADASSRGLSAMAKYQLSRGIARFLPAVTALQKEQLVQVCTTVSTYQKEEKAEAEVLGLYIEGLFLNEEKAGAQQAQFFCEPNRQLLQDLQNHANGCIRIVAVAPELSGALDFICEVKEEVRITLAHSACNYEQALAAFAAGASQVTHLFNAMSPFLHRDPGLVGAAADSDCYVELICDGVHIHPAVVRAVFRLFGAQRIILVSDSMRGTAMPSGRYTLGGQVVNVQEGRVVLSDGTLAGSSSDLMDCLRVAVTFGIPLHEAVMAAAINPAKALGLHPKQGFLQIGEVANLVVLNKDFSLHSVYFRGRRMEALTKVGRWENAK